MAVLLVSAGIQSMLQSDEVEADLMERGERVRQMAQGIIGFSGDVEIQSNPTPNRARVEVMSPLWAESVMRPLGTAIDAARG